MPTLKAALDRLNNGDQDEIKTDNVSYSPDVEEPGLVDSLMGIVCLIPTLTDSLPRGECKKANARATRVD